MYTLLQQKRVRWIGHVHRTDDGRIPKDLLYSELATGKRKKGRPHLRFMDVCKRDMKAYGIDTDNWEKPAANRSTWKSTLFKELSYGEGKMSEQAAVKSSEESQPAHIRRTTKQCTSLYLPKLWPTLQIKYRPLQPLQTVHDKFFNRRNFSLRLKDATES